jgi:hypothetical protein
MSLQVPEHFVKDPDGRVLQALQLSVHLPVLRLLRPDPPNILLEAIDQPNLA